MSKGTKTCPRCGGTGKVPKSSMGDAIKARREALGMTQEELARKIGVSRPQVANLETGRTDVPTKRLIEIARALACKAGDLLP